MKGIVYVSKAMIPFDSEKLFELLAFASARNSELGITGYLFFADGQFVQYIEGESQTVTDLMSRIERDPRHRIVNSLCDDRVLTRRFPEWHMRWLRQEQILGLETVLSNHLAWIKSFEHESDFGQESVWRMVDKLSQLRTKLPH